MDIKIRDKFVEIKYMYCVSYGLGIVITNDWRFRIFEIRRYG